MTAIQNEPALLSSSSSSADLAGLRRYDTGQIERYYSNKGWRAFVRFFQIMLPLFTFGFLVWWDSLTGGVERNQSRRAVRFRETLTKLGPFYIKIGQALSTRPDVVPPIYLEELTLLQDDVPPFPNELAYQLITEELGRTPQEIYQEISPEPIAAASLGQVYKGKLKTGQSVAIKVQRPGLVPQVSLDLYIFRSLIGWIAPKLPFLHSDVVAILDEFGTKLFEEMDYVHEGQNAEHFASLFKTMPEIYVPQIYWEYTRRRVLTMEWVDGIKLTRLGDIQRAGLDGEKLIGIGVQCSLRQLMEYGFFHADPHPGNLLAMADGRLAYLDFGMMSEVTAEQRYGLIDAVVHLVNRDFESLSKDYVRLGFLTPETDLSKITPALREVFQDALGATVNDLNFKSITDKLSGIMYDLPFQVPSYYALIIRSMVTLEGIALSVRDDFKVLAVAYPYVANRMLTDRSPELRNSLNELLFQGGSFRWNRLENLLTNAKDARDYSTDNTLEQILDFLLSDGGSSTRERLLEALFNNQNEGFKRLWALVNKGEQDGRKMPPDPRKYLPIVRQVLARKEGREFGRKLASRWLEQQTARFLRRVLLPSPQVAKALKS
jgi:predicted unusual protein kinase regulating ubiquinone biosynthesis (AarF/ABC1/UbiB family)